MDSEHLETMAPLSQSLLPAWARRQLCNPSLRNTERQGIKAPSAPPGRQVCPAEAPRAGCGSLANGPLAHAARADRCTQSGALRPPGCSQSH